MFVFVFVNQPGIIILRWRKGEEEEPVKLFCLFSSYFTLFS